MSVATALCHTAEGSFVLRQSLGYRSRVRFWLTAVFLAAFVVPAGAQPSPPGAPQNLSGVVTGTAVTLTWQPPSTGGVAGGYLLQASIVPDGPPIASIPVAGPSLVVQSVPSGTYYVRVFASNPSGQGPPSDQLVVTVSSTVGGACLQPPSAPQGLTASASGSLISLRWSAPAGACVPTSYVVHVGSSPGLSNITQVNVGTASTLSANAPPGTYYIRVVALNAIGPSIASNEVNVTVGGGGAELRIPADQASPLWFEIARGDGAGIQFYGTRDSAGIQAIPREFHIRTSSGAAVIVSYSAQGRPERIYSESGFEATLVWSSGNRAELQTIGADGRPLIVPVTFRSRSRMAASAGLNADAPGAADIPGSPRTARVSLDAAGCAVPSNTSVHVRMGGRDFPGRAVPDTPNTFDVDLPSAEPFGGNVCARIPSETQMGLNLDPLTPGGYLGLAGLLEGLALGMATMCPLTGPLFVACELEAGLLEVGALMAVVLDGGCGAAQVVDFFASDRMSALASATVDGHTYFGNFVDVPRTGPVPNMSVRVDCTRLPPPSTTVTGPPSNLAATVTGTRVLLTWSPPTTGTASDYIIEVGSSPGASNVRTISTSVNGLVATRWEASLNPGTYYIRVKAVNARGTSAPSNEVIVVVGSVHIEVPMRTQFIAWPTDCSYVTTAFVAALDIDYGSLNPLLPAQLRAVVQLPALRASPYLSNAGRNCPATVSLPALQIPVTLTNPVSTPPQSSTVLGYSQFFYADWSGLSGIAKLDIAVRWASVARLPGQIQSVYLQYHYQDIGPDFPLHAYDIIGDRTCAAPGC